MLWSDTFIMGAKENCWVNRRIDQDNGFRNTGHLCTLSNTIFIFRKISGSITVKGRKRIDGTFLLRWHIPVLSCRSFLCHFRHRIKLHIWKKLVDANIKYYNVYSSVSFFKFKKNNNDRWECVLSGNLNPDLILELVTYADPKSNDIMTKVLKPLLMTVMLIFLLCGNRLYNIICEHSSVTCSIFLDFLQLFTELSISRQYQYTSCLYELTTKFSTTRLIQQRNINNINWKNVWDDNFQRQC